MRSDYAVKLLRASINIADTIYDPKEVDVKSHVSSSLNLSSWKNLAIMCVLLSAVAYPLRSAAQQSGCKYPKPGWTDLLCDDFEESNVDDLFSGSGFWVSTQGWTRGNGIKGTDGGTYNSPVPALTGIPQDCQQPTINTAFQTPGTLTLTAHADPGNYYDDKLDGACHPYTYTGAEIVSKQAFLYGYFEMRAKVANDGLGWDGLWLQGGGGNTYREIDILEFGTTIKDKRQVAEHLAADLDNNPIGGNGINVYSSSDIEDTSQFHTYALRWTPNSLTWYFDNQQIWQLLGHSSHEGAQVIADNWIAGNGNNPTTFDIDYIRVARSQSNEFMWQWGNGGNGLIGTGSTSDRLVSGEFIDDGKSQILGFGSAESAEMMEFNGSSWDTPWHNKFGLPNWTLKTTDKYVVGHFDSSLPAGQDQLLAINDDDDRAELLSYNASSWTTSWIGGAIIDWWYLGKDDQYIAGDFAGLGFDQLLAVNPNGWAQLMEYYGGSWHMIWTNNGQHWIAGWYLSPGDIFLPGNFEGNANGQKQLLAISTNGSKYAFSLKYAGGQWYTVWENHQSGTIGWWYTNQTDIYVVGNFDGGIKDQVLAVATNGDGWTQLLAYSSAGWDSPWSNDGSNTIDLWNMAAGDKYLGGHFNGNPQQDLFVISTTGYTQLMQRRLPE
jgi:beta-glucanase (GH16 family)